MIRFGLLLLLTGMIVYRLFDRFSVWELRITFFDVGQGDGALIHFPGGKTMLVDSGGGDGNWDAGTAVVFPELTAAAILTLDVALLTHPDRDHGYGFHGILRELKVHELWVHDAFFRDPRPRPLLRSLESLAAMRDTTVRSFDTENEFSMAGARLRLIPLPGPASDRNNRALILLLGYAGCKILFSADIEKQAEQRLLTYSLPEVTVLKVPHHGSRTSSTEPFLKALRPKWAVISAGFRNQYGHPHPGILQRYQEHGISVLRTDFHGFTRFTISRRGKIRCETYLGPCGEFQCGS